MLLLIYLVVALLCVACVTVLYSSLSVCLCSLHLPVIIKVLSYLILSSTLTAIILAVLYIL